MSIRSFLNKIIDSYFLIIIFSLLVGVIFSSKAALLSPYVTVFLGIIFFFSSLKIDMKDVLAQLHDRRMLLVVNIFMLLILPILVYYATSLIAPSIAIAFLILAAMPSGMTAPLLSELSDGKQELALVFTVSTSLLAPITVPLMIKLLAGAAVTVGFYSMFISLAKVIFIPFVIAQIIKRFAEKQIEKISFTFKSISVIFLALLVIGIVAKQADAIVAGFKGGPSIFYIVSLFVLFIIFHLIGYFTAFWRDRRDRITITVCITYMNFTLAIYIVDQFFTEPTIIIPVILSVIPWVLLLPLFQWVMKSRKAA